MLINDNILFHNAVELTPDAGGGLTIQRFPRSVRNDPEVSPVGHVMARLATKCELRFFADGPQVRLFLRSVHEGAAIDIHRGDLLVSAQPWLLRDRAVTEIHLPTFFFNDTATTEIYTIRRFPRTLWRIAFNGSTVAYHGADAMGGAIRPPGKDDQPDVRMLVYGSSITMAGPTFNDYAAIAAEELGWDLLNLGMAGSCHIERSVADWIAARDDWDVGLFELGVNMAGQFEPAVFEQRARHLVQACVERRPDRPVVLLSVLRWSGDARAEPDRGTRHGCAFRRILREITADVADHGAVHFIDGPEVTPDYRGFRADLTHPGDAAHFRIGLRVAERLRNVI